MGSFHARLRIEHACLHGGLQALQQAQLIYLLGSLFVGIAFQAFALMLIGVQCGLWSYLRRIDSPDVRVIRARPKLNIPGAVAAN